MGLDREGQSKHFDELFNIDQLNNKMKSEEFQTFL